MSVLCLLRKASPKVPRFVTLDGQLVFGATLVGSSYQHPVHGQVTKVEPHHFHGGIVEEAEEAELAEAWWVENTECLAAEVERMKLAFPGFVLLDDADKPTWVGSISRPPLKLGLAVSHRRDHSLPTVRVLSPARLERHEGRRFRIPPHTYLNGNPCVASTEDWDGQRHDMVTFVCWVAHWVAAYGEWRMTGAWPSIGYESD